MYFRNRAHAAEELADKLAQQNYKLPLVVLALPRGGVPLGAKIAKQLGGVLDLLVVRKLGVPYHPEFAFGALGPEDYEHIDEQLVESLGLIPGQVSVVIETERKELQRRLNQYRGSTSYEKLTGKTAIIVDDGIATGKSIFVAVKFARSLDPAKLVVATPVCPPDAARTISSLVDDFVVLQQPENFAAVGQFYEQFEQVSDTEVLELMHN